MSIGKFASVVAAITLMGATGWALPLSAFSPIQAPAPRTVPQALTGKVLTVESSSFSIEVTQGDSAKAFTFVIDKDTKIAGKMALGASATVDYRIDENGRNIATRVVFS